MNSVEKSADFLIIGAGVMGLSLALALRQRYGDAQITLIEKEQLAGQHASGRNSGVLHAGFYYSADSLKARFTREGNRRMTRYCEARGIKLNRCGKLVIPSTEEQLPALDELFRRAQINGIEVQAVDARQATEIEPRARCCERGLYSPTTSSVNPADVIKALLDDCGNQAIKVLTGVQYLGRDKAAVMTSQGRLTPGYVINTAGLYAERIAHDFGFAEDYLMLPFKGLYLYGQSSAAGFRTHLYPVPDLQQPFLGVHITLTVDGRVKIGPTAIPCLWREHYSGLRNYSTSEMTEIISTLAGLFIHNDFNFRGLALHELNKARRKTLVADAAKLATGVGSRDFRQWGQPGIRAQLYHRNQRRLEMDFLYEGDDRSFHLLNAVSPAFTCSMALAEHLAAEIVALRGV